MVAGGGDWKFFILHVHTKQTYIRMAVYDVVDDDDGGGSSSGDFFVSF